MKTPDLKNHSFHGDFQIESLLVHRDAICRHSNMPMLKEREAYLWSLLATDKKKKYVANKASLLLNVIRLVKLSDPGHVDEQDIAKATSRWLSESLLASHKQLSRRADEFKALARSWFRFLEVYAPNNNRAYKLEPFHEQFVVGMRDEFGYLPASIKSNSVPVRRFLMWASGSHEHPSTITLQDVDTFLAEGRKRGWSQRTVKGNCSALRSFFRYAEGRGWTARLLSKAIRAPVMGKARAVPPKQSWKQVRRMIGSLDDSKPHECRAKPILLLASIYGMRSSEIARLTLDDLDWHNEVITVRRAKHGRFQQFPIRHEVGKAIVKYLQTVRPRTTFRNVFLTLHTPYRPVHNLSQCMWRLLRQGMLGIQPCGLHSLRHACATELLRQGTSLQAISDLLGHRDMRSVSIYARCDSLALRQVADFGLMEVL